MQLPLWRLRSAASTPSPVAARPAPERARKPPAFLETLRLSLVAATPTLLQADALSGESLAIALGASPARDWPPRYYGADHARAMLARIGDGMPAAWGTRYFLLRAPEPLLVGVGGYKGPPEGGWVEIGYSVVGSHQGRGFATEAARAMAAAAFAVPGVEGVAATTLATLPASIAVLRRCGFVARATEGSGPLRFELRRSAWEARQGAGAPG